MENPLKKHFEEGWWQKLSPFLLSDEFKRIGNELQKQRMQGLRITPLFDDTFRAFRECSYKDLKVVVLGLDPYPALGVADGLAFSARDQWHKEPKSLQYIINSLEKDVYNNFGIGFNEDYLNPDLTRWARQGVLLLNCALSTIVGKTGVHLNLWAPFIRYVFKVLRENNTGIVFILLGAKAKQWSVLIDKSSNHILSASHPASCAYKGLSEWDCEKIFSKTNAILESYNGKDSRILW
jgi:uracil-DNA glycosylase